MSKRARQILAVTFSALLLPCPLLARTAELIGTARATGRVQVNGLTLPAETNVYSGDRVTTGHSSTLTLISSAQERIHFDPESAAQLSRVANITVIALEQGKVSFRSVGNTRAVIEKYGVEIRVNGKSPSIVQVALLSQSEAQVSALRGSVEVSGPRQSIFLQPGRTALISATSTEGASALASASRSAQGQQSPELGSMTGRLVDKEQTVIPFAQVTLISETGVRYTTQTDAVGSFTFDELPPGRYTLRVSKEGFRTYEIENLVVKPGSQSLGLVTIEAGVGAGTVAIITIVVVAGVAAGVAIPLVLRGKEQAPVSPSGP